MNGSRVLLYQNHMRLLYFCINLEYIKKFYNRIKFPLFFLDYETYSSAIPLIRGAKPHAHLPFQFSVHKQMTPNSGIDHFEYLAESAELPEKLSITF